MSTSSTSTKNDCAYKAMDAIASDSGIPVVTGDDLRAFVVHLNEERNLGFKYDEQLPLDFIHSYLCEKWIRLPFYILRFKHIGDSGLPPAAEFVKCEMFPNGYLGDEGNFFLDYYLVLMVSYNKDGTTGAGHYMVFKDASLRENNASGLLNIYQMQEHHQYEIVSASV